MYKSLKVRNFLCKDMAVSLHKFSVAIVPPKLALIKKDNSLDNFSDGNPTLQDLINLLELFRFPETQIKEFHDLINKKLDYFTTPEVYNREMQRWADRSKSGYPCHFTDLSSGRYKNRYHLNKLSLHPDWTLRFYLTFSYPGEGHDLQESLLFTRDC